MNYRYLDMNLYRMDLLTRHRETVLEVQKKWQEYLENLDGKIGIYRERIERN